MTQVKVSELQLEPYIYGVATLASVWAMGGGNNEILWSRILALGVILAVLAISALKFSGQLPDFLSEKINFKIAAGSAVATALPFMLLVYLLKKTTLLPYEMPTPTNLLGLLSLVTLVSFGSEVIYRRFLTFKWGLSTSAFVEGLTLGFGSHYFFLFFAFFAMGHAWGLMLPKFGLKTVVLSRCLWTLFVFLTAYLIQ